jgi:hypothetical protein
LSILFFSTGVDYMHPDLIRNYVSIETVFIHFKLYQYMTQSTQLRKYIFLIYLYMTQSTQLCKYRRRFLFKFDQYVRQRSETCSVCTYMCEAWLRSFKLNLNLN